jgi:hypothetical protein
VSAFPLDEQDGIRRQLALVLHGIVAQKAAPPATNGHPYRWVAQRCPSSLRLPYLISSPLFLAIRQSRTNSIATELSAPGWVNEHDQ